MVAGEQGEFVDNTLELDDVPQIDLPFRDDVSKEFKDLLRAIVINQQNIINNTSFLYDRIKDLSSVLQRLVRDLPPEAPQNPPRQDNA